MSLIHTPAVLLRAFPYSETSKILRFYSQALGVVGVMAKGVRRRASRHGGALVTFSEGTLSVHFRENRELQTFREFSPTRVRTDLAADPLRLAGASVLGELILGHAGEVGNVPLFESLSSGLDRMAITGREEIFPRILAELWGLVADLGYGPSLDRCVECGRDLLREEWGRFDFPAGGVRCAGCAEKAMGPRLGPRAREQLLALLRRSPPRDLVKPRAHLRLANDFITYHVSGGTPLRSIEVMATLLAAPDA
ncbi:DNA repair protein RecO [Gemmatimonadota bacterium]